MSKPTSGLFHGTKGEASFYGNAETVIAARTAELDLSPHPLKRKQLSSKKKAAIARKIRNRTATREESKSYAWSKRFAHRRREGIRNFYAQERERLRNGEQGTRNWSAEQKAAILSKSAPTYNGLTMQAHHTYSASRYPHLANRGEIIYPATRLEHLKGWHGGNYKKSLPGRRIVPIHEF